MRNVVRALPENQAYGRLVETYHHVRLRPDAPRPVPNILEFERRVVRSETPRTRRPGRKHRPGENLTGRRLDLREALLHFFRTQAARVDLDFIQNAVQRVPNRVEGVNGLRGKRKHRLRVPADQQSTCSAAFMLPSTGNLPTSLPSM